MIRRPLAALLTCLSVAGCAQIAPGGKYCPLRDSAQAPAGLLPSGCSPVGPSRDGVTRLDCGSRTGFLIEGL